MDLIDIVSKHSSLPLFELINYVKLPLASNPSFSLALTKLEDFVKMMWIQLPSELTLKEEAIQKQSTIIKPVQIPQSSKVNEACVSSSEVFQINPKEPNIQKHYNKSVDSVVAYRS